MLHSDEKGKQTCHLRPGRGHDEGGLRGKQRWQWCVHIDGNLRARCIYIDGDLRRSYIYHASHVRGSRLRGHSGGCEASVGTCNHGGHTTKAACEAASTCDGVAYSGTQMACEDSVGTCDQGGDTTKADCEASNGGTGVYTSTATYVPGATCQGVAYSGTQTECEDSVGTCDQAGTRRGRIARRATAGLVHLHRRRPSSHQS
jgi:hypothetical protein